MTKPLRFDDEAAEELEAAADWYETQERPATWSLARGIDPDLCVRQCFLRRFPLAVVYVELEKEIRIVAIAHERREPGYWRHRL